MDGVIPGVGGVLVFLPLIAVFFLIFSFLEDLGYFSRAAFIMDRIMRAVGLHGKAFFSLFMGYSCNVAGIMATRMLESRKDRLIAALVNPLIPCSARLGVMSFLAAVFFAGDAATLVMLSLVVLSLVLVALVGLLLQKLVLPSENTYFIMEMPPYRIPTIRGLAIHMYERVGIFVKRAGTFIFLVSIIIWALSSFPEAVELSETYIGQAGRMLEPIGALLGFDWRLMVALIFGFAAKELTLSTLSILYGLEEEAELGIILAASWTPLTAFTFLTVQMIYVPCLATVAVMRKETNSWGWTALGVAYTLALAFVVGLIVYHGGLLIFGGG
ncbi:MAG: ferrous iron transport protein B [Aigarchaeota archaeon]|nr:ferrous iron transport protein B [Candidatus Calditenuaceae archaeon]